MILSSGLIYVQIHRVKLACKTGRQREFSYYSVNVGVRVVNLDLLSSVSSHSLLVYDRFSVFDPIRCLLFCQAFAQKGF